MSLAYTYVRESNSGISVMELRARGEREGVRANERSRDRRRTVDCKVSSARTAARIYSNEASGYHAF